MSVAVVVRGGGGGGGGSVSRPGRRGGVASALLAMLVPPPALGRAVVHVRGGRVILAVGVGLVSQVLVPLLLFTAGYIRRSNDEIIPSLSFNRLLEASHVSLCL